MVSGSSKRSITGLPEVYSFFKSYFSLVGMGVIMFSKEKEKIVREWAELEADAQHELNLAHHSRGKEEQEEHYMNAIVAEQAASYLYKISWRTI